MPTTERATRVVESIAAIAPPFVHLTTSELARAYRIGNKRNDLHTRNGRRSYAGEWLEKYGAPEGIQKELHIIGAAAELAVAKYFALDWSGEYFDLSNWLEYRKTGHDVGRLEVRTNYRWRGELIIKPKDDNRSPFLLVRTDTQPIFYLYGFLPGIEGKKREYFISRGWRSYYGVPYTDLYDLSELPDYLEGKWQ